MPRFELYKPAQGKYVRWGTVIAIGILVGFGMYWLGTQVLGSLSLLVQSLVVVPFGLAGAGFAVWLINTPKAAEFMIMTESEMRKVNWPSRSMVINSTKVVIFLTLVLACLLFVVDDMFMCMMGLLRSGINSADTLTYKFFSWQPWSSVTLAIVALLIFGVFVWAPWRRRA